METQTTTPNVPIPPGPRLSLHWTDNNGPTDAVVFTLTEDKRRALHEQLDTFLNHSTRPTLKTLTVQIL